MDMPHKVTREQQLKLPSRKVKTGNSGSERSTDAPGHISVTSVTAVTRNARLYPGYPGGVGSEGPGHWTQRLFGTIGVVTEVTLVMMAVDYRDIPPPASPQDGKYIYSPTIRGPPSNHKSKQFKPTKIGEKAVNIDDKENKVTYWDLMSDDEYWLVVQAHVGVLEYGPGIIRVLGEDHPVAKIIAPALETGDPRHLEDASKAVDVLSEEVLDKVRHPWVGHPPPVKTPEELFEQISGRPNTVEWFLQIQGFQTPIPAESEIEKSPEKSEISVDAKIVYERAISGHPLRLLIREGSDKEVVLDLLRQVTDLLEREWDELIDPKHYSDPPDAA